ncbi:hypothetical protein M3J09_009635 [Ascochyta lentis]
MLDKAYRASMQRAQADLTGQGMIETARGYLETTWGFV